MDIIAHVFSFMDFVLMPVYRFPDNPVAGFFLGTCVLSGICLILEKFSVSFAIHINKDKINVNSDEIRHYQDISIRALRAGNKDVFRACNRISHDAFGKLFFSRACLSAAALWPVGLALGWLQYRFADVNFAQAAPVSGADYLLGYITIFALCSVIVRIILHTVKVFHTMLRPV